MPQHYHEATTIRRRATPSPKPDHSGQAYLTHLPPPPTKLARPENHLSQCHRGKEEYHTQRNPCPALKLSHLSVSEPSLNEPCQWFPVPLSPMLNTLRPPSPQPLSRCSTTSSRNTCLSGTTLCTGLGEEEKILRPPYLIYPLPTKFTNKYPQPRLGIDTQNHSPDDGDDLGFETLDKWTVQKCCLLLGAISVFLYGMAGVTCAILIWLRAWPLADVLLVTDSDILILFTIAAFILVLTSIIGLTGTLLSSRPLLAVYVLLLWPSFISLLAIGYASYKRETFSLDRKLNLAWSQWYTPLGRLVIQNALGCCGYNSPLHAQTPSKRCYARAPLRGCKGPLLRFERSVLATTAAAIFALVPLHILNIVVALLCANHVTHAFGTAIMPRQYRLYGAELERMWNNLEHVGLVKKPLATRVGGGLLREDKEDRHY